jgi:outer membrane protein, multidrug efflux system
MLLNALMSLVLFGGAATTGDQKQAPAKASDTAADLEMLVHGPWWNSFAVPGMGQAIETGLRNNPDIQVLSARLSQMQAGAWQSIAPAFPSLSFDMNGSLAPYDSLGFQMGGQGPPSIPGEDPPTLYYSGSTMLNLRVPLDVAGRQAFAYRANLLEAKATLADGQSQAVQIVGSIANAFFDVLAARNQSELLERQHRTNQELLLLLQRRFESGEATALDILQQKQQLAASASLVPAAKSQVKIQEHRLQVLLGSAQSDRDSIASLLPAQYVFVELPALPDEIKQWYTGTNRPEIRSAQTRIDASSSQIVNAYMSFLPSLQLSGNAGYQGLYIDELNEQFTYGAGIGLSIPIFQGASSIASLRQAYASKLAAELTAQSLDNQIRQQVEEALMQEDAFREQLTLQQDQQRAAKNAFEESQKRYLAGLANYQAVLLALQSIHQTELSILSTKRSLLSARIFFHQSIGGHWTEQIGKR